MYHLQYGYRTLEPSCLETKELLKRLILKQVLAKKKFMTKGDTAPWLHPFNVPVKIDTEIMASILERGVAQVHSERVNMHSEQVNVGLK